MSLFKLTPDAKSDLTDIRRYSLQEWGKEQSQHYLAELRQGIILLAKKPNLGKLRKEVGEDVRSYPCTRHHVVYYIPHESSIVVFAVLHKRMLPEQHLTERTHT